MEENYVLIVLGRRVLHTGEIDTASTLKIMTNYLATVNLVALGESRTTMKVGGLVTKDIGLFQDIQIVIISL